jgi:Domain of unknown function (DUF4352)
MHNVMPQGPDQPRKKRHILRNVLLSILGLFVLLIIIGVATGGGKSTGTGAASTSSTPPASAGSSAATVPGSAAPAVSGPGIGFRADDGKFRFVVTSVSHAKSAGSSGLGATAQGEYTVLHVTVTNIGSAAQTLDDSAQYVYDSRSRQYSADTQADIYGNSNGGQVFLAQINPGDSITGLIYFDMPVGDHAVKAVLHDSMFSGGVSVSLRPAS